MARQLRLEYEGAIYHVTVRGNNRKDLFLDDFDRHYLLKRLTESIEQCEVRLYLYCLLDNHLHLVCETPRANLTDFMHGVLTGYTVVFNHRHGRSGHVTQGRYGARLVSGDDYLLKLSRYVHLNPVKTEAMKARPLEERVRYLRQYRWSSYPGYIGEGPRKEFVDYDPMLSLMQVRGRKRQQAAYRKFVEAGVKEDDRPFLESLWRSSRSIGNEDFREWVDDCYAEVIRSRPNTEDISFRRIEQTAVPVEDVLRVVAKECGLEPSDLRIRRRDSTCRGVAGMMLCRYSRLTQRQAAEVLGLTTGASVSYQIQKVRARLAGEEALQKTVGRLTRRLDSILSE